MANHTIAYCLAIATTIATPIVIANVTAIAGHRMRDAWQTILLPTAIAIAYNHLYFYCLLSRK